MIPTTVAHPYQYGPSTSPAYTAIYSSLSAARSRKTHDGEALCLCVHGFPEVGAAGH
jgi:hypothetical protein